MIASEREVHFAMSVPAPQLAVFCKKWKLSRLELFGSILRDDFGTDSDVDVLITFQEGAGPTFLGIFEMKDELRVLFQRRIDLLTRESVEESKNAIRRQSILNSAVVVYAK